MGREKKVLVRMLPNRAHPELWERWMEYNGYMH